MKPGSALDIGFALDTLRHLPFPKGYLEQVQNDMVATLTNRRPPKSYCYLGFFGHANKALYLKIGKSDNPKVRIRTLSTSNPMTPLWLWAAECESGTAALAVERVALGFLDEQRVAGEWVALDGIEREGVHKLVYEIAQRTEMTFHPLDL